MQMATTYEPPKEDYIGLDAGGTFRTAVLKEYAGRFSGGLAQANWTNFASGIMPVERSVQVKRTWRHGSLQLRQLWDRYVPRT